jgi:glycine cleavage system H protein
MHRLPNHLRELYFTPDHEWIRFEGSVATIGLSSFKLTGYKKISAYFFMESEDVIAAGTPVASFEYADYIIELQMPVTGKIMQWNKTLFAESAINMLGAINQFTWIARITPATPYERTGLMQAIHYKPLLKAHGLVNL